MPIRRRKVAQRLGISVSGSHSKFHTIAKNPPQSNFSSCGQSWSSPWQGDFLMLLLAALPSPCSVSRHVHYSVWNGSWHDHKFLVHSDLSDYQTRSNTPKVKNLNLPTIRIAFVFSWTDCPLGQRPVMDIAYSGGWCLTSSLTPIHLEVVLYDWDTRYDPFYWWGVALSLQLVKHQAQRTYVIPLYLDFYAPRDYSSPSKQGPMFVCLLHVYDGLAPCFTHIAGRDSCKRDTPIS